MILSLGTGQPCGAALRGAKGEDRMSENPKNDLEARRQEWSDAVREILKPISPAELYKRTLLTDQEIEIFKRLPQKAQIRIRSQWLRFKHGDLPQLLHLIAVVNSDVVTGRKKNYISGILGSHLEIDTRIVGRGLRNDRASDEYYDRIFELRVLALFAHKGFTIELLVGSEVKAPEFIARKDQIELEVECKNLDADAVLDNIFGDGRSPERWEPEYQIPEDYDANGKKIRDQYAKALAKFHNRDRPYMVFIDIHGAHNYGDGLREFEKNVAEDQQADDRFSGLVLWAGWPNGALCWYRKDRIGGQLSQMMNSEEVTTFFKSLSSDPSNPIMGLRRAPNEN